MATNPGPMPDPSDFRAFDAWREAGGGVDPTQVAAPAKPAAKAAAAPAAEEEEAVEGSEYVAPATGEEEESPSDADTEAAAAEVEGEESETGEGDDSTSDETAAESETAEEAETAKPSKGIEKRFRKQANRIAELNSTVQELREKLAAVLGEAEGEGEEEETETTEAAQAAATPEEIGPAPQLADYDTLEEWRKAFEAHNQKLIAAAAAQARKEAKAEHAADAARAAQAAADAEWSRQASRFPDYNNVVTDDTKISHAMAAVMRRDPEAGTRIAYYLGQHPEEAKKIAEMTLAKSEGEWAGAVALAGIKLGTILAKLPESTAPVKGGGKTPATKPAVSKTPVKEVSKASRPPASIRAQAVAPTPKSSMEVDAADYKKWLAAREREIASQRR